MSSNLTSRPHVAALLAARVSFVTAYRLTAAEAAAVVAYLRSLSPAP